jgi:hypothetical protein
MRRRQAARCRIFPERALVSRTLRDVVTIVCGKICKLG